MVHVSVFFNTFHFCWVYNCNDLEITVKVKSNMRFSKIFEAAEVCCHSIFLSLPSLVEISCLETIWETIWSVPCALCFMEGLYIAYSFFFVGTLRFTYEGRRIAVEDTPASVSRFSFQPAKQFSLNSTKKKLEMEDGDQIDAFLEQVGAFIGCFHEDVHLHMLT